MDNNDLIIQPSSNISDAYSSVWEHVDRCHQYMPTSETRAFLELVGTLPEDRHAESTEDRIAREAPARPFIRTAVWTLDQAFWWEGIPRRQNISQYNQIGQRLQWPRFFTSGRDYYFEISEFVPKDVKEIYMDFAFFLAANPERLIEAREPGWNGIREEKVGEITTKYDKSDRLPLIPVRFINRVAPYVREGFVPGVPKRTRQVIL